MSDPRENDGETASTQYSVLSTRRVASPPHHPTASHSHAAGMSFDLAATAGLAEPKAPPVVAASAARAVHSKAVASARIPQWEMWRETAHRIKAWTMAHLDRLLVQFETQVTARGGKVLWAEN